MTDETGITSIPSQLFIWLSPAFPVSSFAYSNGLEAAVENGWVANADELFEWLDDVTTHGSLKTDLILQSLIHRAESDNTISDIIELASALQPSSERAYEAMTQGKGFRDGYVAGWASKTPSIHWKREDLTLPIAIGLATREHDLPLKSSLQAYACSVHGNLTAAAMRLGVLGQYEVQRVLSKLSPAMKAACHAASIATEMDLGTATFVADLASIHHETQQPRIFRT